MLELQSSDWGCLDVWSIKANQIYFEDLGRSNDLAELRSHCVDRSFLHSFKWRIFQYVATRLMII